MSQAARTAVVVGAGRGLGRGIADAFCTEGYRVTDPRMSRWTPAAAVPTLDSEARWHSSPVLNSSRRQ
jgi:NAD(P)-dependent dehydrogenase (short-subunit alcohol dehydrogenase family)